MKIREKTCKINKLETLFSDIYEKEINTGTSKSSSNNFFTTNKRPIASGFL